jgi:hypothetical protein
LSENGYPEAMADPSVQVFPLTVYLILSNTNENVYFQIEYPIMGSPDPTVTEFMAPGFILSLAFFCAIATAALTLVLDRKDGLLERSLVSGKKFKINSKN